MYKSMHMLKTRGEKSENHDDSLFYHKSFLSCTCYAFTFICKAKKIISSSILGEKTSHAIYVVWRNWLAMYLYVLCLFLTLIILHYLQWYLRYFVMFPLYIHFDVTSKQHRNHRCHRSVELNEGESGIQFVQLFHHYCLIN